MILAIQSIETQCTRKVSDLTNKLEAKEKLRDKKEDKIGMVSAIMPSVISYATLASATIREYLSDDIDSERKDSVLREASDSLIESLYHAERTSVPAKKMAGMASHYIQTLTTNQSLLETNTALLEKLQSLSDSHAKLLVDSQDSRQELSYFSTMLEQLNQKNRKLEIQLQTLEEEVCQTTEKLNSQTEQIKSGEINQSPTISNHSQVTTLTDNDFELDEAAKKLAQICRTLAANISQRNSIFGHSNLNKSLSLHNLLSTLGSPTEESIRETVVKIKNICAIKRNYSYNTTASSLEFKKLIDSSNNPVLKSYYNSELQSPVLQGHL